ncbi:Coiled-coil-helix-coiled-coil-helix domain-containing protein 7 [Anthophora quadrimaculata]
MATFNNNTTDKPKSRKVIKRNQELYNPCFKEYNLSHKCLETNEYNYKTCEPYFENYRVCKKFWGKVIALRRADNITPFVPLPEDRERIKAEYLRSHKYS